MDGKEENWRKRPDGIWEEDLTTINDTWGEDEIG